jgi:hypothetical protein
MATMLDAIPPGSRKRTPETPASPGNAPLIAEMTVKSPADQGFRRDKSGDMRAIRACDDV